MTFLYQFYQAGQDIFVLTFELYIIGSEKGNTLVDKIKRWKAFSHISLKIPHKTWTVDYYIWSL